MIDNSGVLKTSVRCDKIKKQEFINSALKMEIMNVIEFLLCLVQKAIEATELYP